MDIYFLQFNSKINRIVKRYPTLDGYSPFIIIGPKTATNFPYADGVVTKEVYNFYDAQIMPDYAIIVNSTGEVTSRWYVEQAEYTRNGQTAITFRRDVLADFYDKVINATSLIEKATVSDSDPAIYNQEQITFNQIKKSEKLLKDKTNTAWLVGYVSTDNSVNKKYTGGTTSEIKKTVAGIENWAYYKYTNSATPFKGDPKYPSYQIKIRGNSESIYLGQIALTKSGAGFTDTVTPYLGYHILSLGDFAYNSLQYTNSGLNTFNAKGIIGGSLTYSLSEIYSSIISKSSAIAELQTAFLQSLSSESNPIHTEDEVAEIKSFDGKKIYDSVTTKTYEIKVNTTYEALNRFVPNQGNVLYNKIKDLLTSTNKVEFNEFIYANNNDIYVKYFVDQYTITLTEVESDIVNVDFTSDKRVLNDAPYTMFAIPYSHIPFNVSGGVKFSNPAAALGIARQISLELMSSKALYDLQLLPYCPRQDLMNVNQLDVTYGAEHYDYEFITDANDEVQSVVLFAKESSFTFDIFEDIQITEKKVQNQCDMWRLCSPNYNGVFEFNAAKNNGVDYFNVDCTYRPYNPYIHINPNFKELYGSDFDDARGLICSGDFSMPAATDRWLEYEAQNKNYQNSFDRSIQHLEIEQKYQRINQISGAIAGLGTGAISGGIAGGVGGAIAGGLLSAAGGVADVLLSEGMRQEQIAYQKDQFSFNLENIKALPNSLAKVSAFTKNNKLFPFLEYYTCTDVEKEAFRNMLKFDGMTVNRIGQIIRYLKDNDLQYIKARLIRCDIHDDLHIVRVIAEEMAKGAYYDTRND